MQTSERLEQIKNRLAERHVDVEYLKRQVIQMLDLLIEERGKQNETRKDLS